MNKTLGKKDIDGMEQRYRANFVNSLSGFKSANLIGTQDNKGLSNLSIVSSVFHLGSNPALFGMIIRPHSVARDTLDNILSTKHYTINHVNLDIIKSAHQTSARYDKELSEFNETGLNEYYSDRFIAPYVKESFIKMGLNLREVKHLDINGTELVIGELFEVIVSGCDVLDDGYVDLEQARTCCISGLDSYHRTERVDRFRYAKPDKEPMSILEP